MGKALLGCIADDFTGASDLANNLVRSGMRTIQFIGLPAEGDIAALGADAWIIALKSRTAPVAEAVDQSLEALRWLERQGCTQIMFKYCSTFDSTQEGNIGPVSEALLQAMQEDFTIACPAFPETGRTVYRGHLFVNDALLNESGMENHPLTPMTDANLVRFLAKQTRLPVGLIRYDHIAAGESAVRERITALKKEGVKIAVVDALSNNDLFTVGRAVKSLRFITGGSGIALGLPENFRQQGQLAPYKPMPMSPQPGRSAVLSGSASIATNRQVSHWVDSGRPAFRIDPLKIADGEDIAGQALEFAADEESFLIYATSLPDQVKHVQQILGASTAGKLVERTLGQIALGLYSAGIRKFVIAGGESSGAVVQALGIRILRIGEQIDPGVPVMESLDRPARLALKSGNFGSEDFFAKAIVRLSGVQS